eukprot:TCONS_00013643-protein
MKNWTYFIGLCFITLSTAMYVPTATIKKIKNSKSSLQFNQPGTGADTPNIFPQKGLHENGGIKVEILKPFIPDIAPLEANSYNSKCSIHKTNMTVSRQGCGQLVFEYTYCLGHCSPKLNLQTNKPACQSCKQKATIEKTLPFVCNNGGQTPPVYKVQMASSCECGSCT